MSPPSAPPARVLVIEDDVDVLDLLVSHVRRLGCTVVGSESGEHALALACADPPDVVIVDMLLPGMDGREVVRALRAGVRTAACRIVVSSVLDPQDVSDLAAELLVDATLPKPFSRTDVARVLGDVLSRATAEGKPA